MNLQENIRKILREESLKKTLINMIGDEGIETISRLSGGDENLLDVLNVKTPMDFLHLFDDMEVVQSEKDPKVILFRYGPKNNLMVYNTKTKFFYVRFHKLWRPLASLFKLEFKEVQNLINLWLREVHNIKNTKTNWSEYDKHFYID